jgi:hypothetical protein
MWKSDFKAAIRKKYKNPEDAMKALGLPVSLLYAARDEKLAMDLLEDTMRSEGERLSTDPNEDEQENTKMSDRDAYWRHVACSLDAESWAELQGILQAEAGEGNTAMDDPEPFSGRPNVGGQLDPLKAANDKAIARRKKEVRLSAKGAASFKEMFPDAERLGGAGDYSRSNAVHVGN